jgi:hypothetical protein
MNLISTTELSNIVGLRLGVNDIKALGLEPEAETGTGTFWPADAPQRVCERLSDRLNAKAIEMESNGVSAKEAESNRLKALMHIEIISAMELTPDQIQKHASAAMYLIQRAYVGSTFRPYNYFSVLAEAQEFLD